MAIERAKDMIGVEAGQRTSTTFRTELPDPGATTIAGFQQLGAKIEAAGEELRQMEAEKTAKDAAHAAPLEIDPATGTYKLPKAPESYGPATAKIFDEISERRTMQMSLQGIQAGLNEDAVKYLDDPDGGRKVMQARIDGAMKGMDPRIAGQLGPALLGEVNERHRSLLNDAATRARAANIDGLKQVVAKNDADIADLSSVTGENAEAATKKRDGLIAEQAKNLALLQQRHALDPLHVGMMEEHVRGLTAAGNMMQVMKERLDAGTLTAKDLDDLTRVAGGLSSDKENVLGFTGEWIRENLKSPESRAALMSNLQKSKALLAEKFVTQANDQRYAAIEDGINRGARMFPSNVPADEKERHIERYARERWGSHVAALDPNNAQEILDRYGELPGKMYAHAFAGIRGRDQKAIGERIQLYIGLKTMQGQDGRPDSQTHLISEKDQAFMEHVIAEGGGALGPDGKIDPGALGAAIDTASKLIDAGARDAEGLARYNAKMSEKTPEDFRKAAAANIANGSFFNEKWENLSDEQQLTLRRSAAAYMVNGLDEKKALELAAKRFNDIYVRAPAYTQAGKHGGWVRKDHIVEGVSSLEGAGAEDRRWLKESVNALVNPKGETQKVVGLDGVETTLGKALPEGAVTKPDMKLVSRDGKPIPTTAELEKDLFLVPVGPKQKSLRTHEDGRPLLTDNGEKIYDNTTRYQLVYYNKDGIPSPVIDAANQRPVFIEPGRAQRYNQANILRQKAERQDLQWGSTAEEATAAGAATQAGPLPGRSLVRALPGQVDLPPNVNWILPEAPGGKVGERAPALATGRGGRGGAMRGGRYDDTEVRPDVTFPEGFQPDVPSRKAGETSAQVGNPGEGFKIPGAPAQIIDRTSAADPRWAAFGKIDKVEGLIIHHTGPGMKTADDVIGVFKKRNFPAQYIIDRDGQIVQALPDGARGQHLKPSEINGLSNANAVGVEIIANDDSDILPKQVDAARALTEKLGLRPDQVFGHGEVNSHKQKTEGATVVRSLRAYAGEKAGSEGNGAAKAIRDSAAPAPTEQVRSTFGDNGAIATDYFSRRGYDPHVVAGMVGVLFGESTGFDPKASGDPTIPGGSKGIGQWNKDRLNGRDGLLAFAAEHGVRADNIGTQLAFIEHELQTKERTTWVRLKSAKTVDEAVQAFMGYERPQGYREGTPEAGKHYAKRLEAARKLQTLIGSKNG